MVPGLVMCAGVKVGLHISRKIPQMFLGMYMLNDTRFLQLF